MTNKTYTVLNSSCFLNIYFVYTVVLVGAIKCWLAFEPENYEPRTFRTSPKTEPIPIPEPY